MKIRTPHEVQRKPRLGSLTQLVECLLCKQDVRSSILLGSTTRTPRSARGSFVFFATVAFDYGTDLACNIATFGLRSDRM